MTEELLRTIEWHDLPLERLSITEDGIELVVLGWVAEADDYVRHVLRIANAEHIFLKLNGDVSAGDFKNFEIAKFDFVVTSDGRLTGAIGILPGAAGYWDIRFESAAWALS